MTGAHLISSPPHAPADVALENPFPGLRPFEADEAHLFFVRDGQSSAIVERLAARRFVAVVGTSGSGKSSLVRAGLIPMLEGGFMASAGSAWRVAVVRPGSNPICRLAEALSDPQALGGETVTPELRTSLMEAVLRRSAMGLIDACQQARLPEQENLLVVVDQFEELFRFHATTAGANASDGAAFVNLLLEAVLQRTLPIYVVLTMRSDFLGDCARFRDLPEMLNDGQYLIPRLSRDQRRNTIEGPIAVSGANIAPRLTQRILNDAGEDPDVLPVLQHALMRTWDAWYTDGPLPGPIDLQHYERVGGMAGALSQHADQGYADLAAIPGAQAAAQSLFRGLCERGADSRETRRPAKLGHLCAVAGTDLATMTGVIDEFRRDGRTFLMPGWPTVLEPDTVIDISHEALIRQWEKLRGWVQLETRSAALYQRLKQTAQLWPDNAAVWGNPDLERALIWKDEERPNPAWATRYGTAEEFERAVEFLNESKRIQLEEAEQEAAAAREKMDKELLAREVQLLTLQQEAERQKQISELKQRKVRVFRIATAVSVFFGLIAVVAAGIAVQQWNLENQRVSWADSQQLLRSRDGAEVVSGLAQLSRDLGADNAIDLLEDATLQSNVLIAVIAEVLDTNRRAPSADTASLLREGIRWRMAFVRKIEAAPTPDHDEAINRRVAIAGGSFAMGSPASSAEFSEKPQHQVTLTPFLMQEHEVTNAEYRRFDPSHNTDKANDLPAVGVSWYDAMAYAVWLGGNLPTEAQWEYAARGASGRTYPWGEAALSCDRGNVLGSCQPSGLRPVTPNREAGKTPQGIYDLAGNAFEWCRDWFGAYSRDAQSNPLGAAPDTARVIRGGSFNSDSRIVRAAARSSSRPDIVNQTYGFRVVWPNPSK